MYSIFRGITIKSFLNHCIYFNKSTLTTTYCCCRCSIKSSQRLNSLYLQLKHFSVCLLYTILYSSCYLLLFISKSLCHTNYMYFVMGLLIKNQMACSSPSQHSLAINVQMNMIVGYNQFEQWVNILVVNLNRRFQSILINCIAVVQWFVWDARFPSDFILWCNTHFYRQSGKKAKRWDEFPFVMEYFFNSAVFYETYKKQK